MNFCACGNKIGHSSWRCRSCAMKGTKKGITSVVIKVPTDEVDEINKFAISRGTTIDKLMLFFTKEGIKYEKQVFGEIKSEYENSVLDFGGT